MYFFSIFLSDILKFEYNAVLFTLHIETFWTIQILQHHIMLPPFFLLRHDKYYLVESSELALENVYSLQIRLLHSM